MQKKLKVCQFVCLSLRNDRKKCSAAHLWNGHVSQHSEKRAKQGICRLKGKIYSLMEKIVQKTSSWSFKLDSLLLQLFQSRASHNESWIANTGIRIRIRFDMEIFCCRLWRLWCFKEEKEPPSLYLWRLHWQTSCILNVTDSAILALIRRKVH
jgi:hypothetical protein